MTEQQAKKTELEEITDKLSVTLNLNSNDEWNLSARELMSRIRMAEQNHIDLQAKAKEYFINIQSVVNALYEIQKKTPTFEIVNNIQAEEINPDGKEK